jgi:hypothetical protein
VIKLKLSDKKLNRQDVRINDYFSFFLKNSNIDSEQKIRDKEEQKTVWDGGVIPATPTT